MITVLLAVVHVVMTFTLVALLVIWLTMRWNDIDPGIRQGCVIAALILPPINIFLSWDILRRTEGVPGLTWLTWGINYAIIVVNIPIAIHAVKLAAIDKAKGDGEDDPETGRDPR